MLDWFFANYVECLGTFGAIIVLISMAIPSTHRRQNILMRIINIIGSLVLIIYSAKLAQPAMSNIVLNAVVSIINLYYIIKIYVSMRHDNKKLFYIKRKGEN